MLLTRAGAQDVASLVALICLIPTPDVTFFAQRSYDLTGQTVPLTTSFLPAT
jgi:hypothetical protein